jgi:fructoselysine transporter
MPDAADPGNAPRTLSRSLGPMAVMLLAFSALSPVFSVYIAGDAILKLAGTGAALAMLIGGLAAAILGMLYAEVGAAFPGAGGIYPSLSALLGRMAAFPYIVLVTPIAFAQVGFTALGLADYARVLAPGVPYMPLVFGSIAAATAVALLNIRFGAWVTGIFLAVETVALTILTVVAVSHPVRSLGTVIAYPTFLDHGAMRPTPLLTLALAVVAGVWTCGGASWGMYFAEEMHEARRKIGRVIAWTGLLASMTIAGPMILMVLSARNVPSILGAEAPMAAYLSQTGGPTIAAVVSAGVAAAIFNSMIATIMAYGRFLYATGRDGIWPGPVSRVMATLHPRLKSPVAATLILVVGGALITLIGEKRILILVSGNVSDYLLISLAVLRGRKRGQTGQTWRAPLHPMVPIFGLTVTAFSVAADWLDPDAGRPSIVLLTALFLGAMAYYHFRLRQVSKTWTMGLAEAEPVAE